MEMEVAAQEAAAVEMEAAAQEAAAVMEVHRVGKFDTNAAPEQKREIATNKAGDDVRSHTHHVMHYKHLPQLVPARDHQKGATRIILKDR